MNNRFELGQDIVLGSDYEKAGDTVLVAGKGHEQGQDIAGVVRPFDDRQVLREAIQKTQG